MLTIYWEKKKVLQKVERNIYVYIFHFLCGDMVVVVVVVLVGPCFRISCCCLRRIAASRASKVMLLASARAFNDVSIP